MYTDKQPHLRKDERGSVIVMTTLFMSLLFLMVGLCIDISRIYMMRTELQNAADAAALTAARELNQGTGGIDDAVARATEIVNTRGFAKNNVTIASVQFAVNLNDDPYLSAADAKVTPTTIRFVKVTTASDSTSIFFAIAALGTSHAETRTAVAGMSAGLSGICDFFPAAVALADPSPTPGTLMSLTFNQGTGNEAVLNDKEFIILEVPAINGNGTGETAQLTAGLPNFCKALGDNINMTPSSNQNNGPRNAGDGLNTRFDIYQNGYGGAISSSNWQTFPPDSNVQENITATQYKNRTAVTPPGQSHQPGQDDRRMIVAPIIAPGTYPAYTTNILAWGVFFLKAQSPVPQGNCSNTPGCGSMPVEYVGKANTGSGTGVVSAGSSLTIPVLYK